MASFFLACIQAESSLGVSQDSRVGTHRQKDMKSREVGTGKEVLGRVQGGEAGAGE